MLNGCAGERKRTGTVKHPVAGAVQWGMKTSNRWTYANQDFDTAQHIALALTDEDRAAGRPAPAYGYSKENIDKAWEILRNGA